MWQEEFSSFKRDMVEAQASLAGLNAQLETLSSKLSFAGIEGDSARNDFLLQVKRGCVGYEG